MECAVRNSGQGTQRHRAGEGKQAVRTQAGFQAESKSVDTEIILFLFKTQGKPKPTLCIKMKLSFILFLHAYCMQLEVI